MYINIEIMLDIRMIIFMQMHTYDWLYVSE